MAFPLEDVLQALSFFFFCRCTVARIAEWFLQSGACCFFPTMLQNFQGSIVLPAAFALVNSAPFPDIQKKKKFNSCGPNNAPKLHLGHKTCLCGWLQINLDHLEVFNVYRNLNTRVFWFSPPSKNPLVFNNGCISWIRAPFSISLYTTSSDIFSFVVATVC